MGKRTQQEIDLKSSVIAYCHFDLQFKKMYYKSSTRVYLNVINKCNAETRITFAEKIQQEYFMTFTYSSFEFTYLSITLVF